MPCSSYSEAITTRLESIEEEDKEAYTELIREGFLLSIKIYGRTMYTKLNFSSIPIGVKWEWNTEYWMDPK